MKKSKVKNYGIGVVAKLLGHKPLPYVKRYTRILARLTKLEEREHMEMKKRYTSREWEIIKIRSPRQYPSSDSCHRMKTGHSHLHIHLR